MEQRQNDSVTTESLWKRIEWSTTYFLHIIGRKAIGFIRWGHRYNVNNIEVLPSTFAEEKESIWFVRYQGMEGPLVTEYSEEDAVAEGRALAAYHESKLIILDQNGKTRTTEDYRPGSLLR